MEDHHHLPPWTRWPVVAVLLPESHPHITTGKIQTIEYIISSAQTRAIYSPIYDILDHRHLSP